MIVQQALAAPVAAFQRGRNRGPCVKAPKMFLLRCLFWLGLVFSQIAQIEGSSASSVAAQAAGQAAQTAAQAAARGAGGEASVAARMATQAVERQCRAEPGKCLATAAQIAGQASGAAKLAAAGQDSLTAADRAPTWREAR